MIRMLVSVKNVAEARDAADAGADFIDLKDPAAGALGGLAPALIGEIVGVLRAAPPRALISATIGDVDAAQRGEILARVAAVAGCGVDYVKVGVERSPLAEPLLAALARCGATVVPVLIADDGIDMALVREALAHDSFPALMVDTQDKRAGSLLQRCPAPALREFVATVRARGVLCGLAGALRASDLPRLRELAPDFAGFRSAVCAADRTGALEAVRVRELKRGLGGALPLPHAVSSGASFNASMALDMGSDA